MEHHFNWFQETVNSPTTQLFILMLGTNRIGVLRVDDLKSIELNVFDNV